MTVRGVWRAAATVRACGAAATVRGIWGAAATVRVWGAAATVRAWEAAATVAWKAVRAPETAATVRPRRRRRIVVVAVSSAGEPGEPSVNAPATGCEHAASSSSLSRRCLVVLCTAVLTPPLGSGVRGSSEAREGATVGGLGHCSEAGGRQGLCLQSSRRGTTIGRTLGRTPRQNTGQNI